ncbi:MAG: hypothetical protein ACL93V_00190 [Candidatus Electrothrix sp. YB6]
MEQENNAFPLDRFMDIGAVTSIAVGLVYTAGWYYTSNYFGRFHLNVEDMGFQYDTFLRYGLVSLKDNLYAAGAGAGSVVYYFFIRYLWQRTGQGNSAGTRRKWRTICRLVILTSIPLFLFFLFVTVQRRATWTAWSNFEKQISNDFPAYPRVRVYLNGDPTLQTEEWAGGCYRLLLRNQEYLYIFPADGFSEKIPTEVIPNSRVDALRVLPLYQSSEECQ